MHNKFSQQGIASQSIATYNEYGMMHTRLMQAKRSMFFHPMLWINVAIWASVAYRFAHLVK